MTDRSYVIDTLISAKAVAARIEELVPRHEVEAQHLHSAARAEATLSVAANTHTHVCVRGRWQAKKGRAP